MKGRWLVGWLVVKPRDTNNIGYKTWSKDLQERRQNWNYKWGILRWLPRFWKKIRKKMSLLPQLSLYLCPKSFLIFWRRQEMAEFSKNSWKLGGTQICQPRDLDIIFAVINKSIRIRDMKNSIALIFIGFGGPSSAGWHNLLDPFVPFPWSST